MGLNFMSQITREISPSILEVRKAAQEAAKGGDRMLSNSILRKGLEATRSNADSLAIADAAIAIGKDGYHEVRNTNLGHELGETILGASRQTVTPARLDGLQPDKLVLHASSLDRVQREGAGMLSDYSKNSPFYQQMQGMEDTTIGTALDRVTRRDQAARIAEVGARIGSPNAVAAVDMATKMPPETLAQKLSRVLFG